MVLGPDGLRLNLVARRAFIEDSELQITMQLFNLLAFFLEHRGAALSFEELAAPVWARPRRLGDHHLVHTAVYRLRRALTAAGLENEIEAVRRYGYRLNAERPAAAPPNGSGDATGLALAVFDPTDPSRRISMANEATARLTGYGLRELTTQAGSMTRLWEPEQLAVVDEAVQDALSSGSAESLGRDLRRASGETVTVDVVFSRVHLAKHEPLCAAELSAA